MAESVDALDLKSNRGQPSVPVQVWPGANKKDSQKCESFFIFTNNITKIVIDIILIQDVL